MTARNTAMIHLLASVCLVACLSGCTLPKDPCVPAFTDGTYQVDLIERYVDGGTFAFNPDLVGTGGPAPVDCTERNQLNPGGRLTFRTKGDDGDVGRGCRYRVASLVDPRVTGQSELNRGFGTDGWLFRSRDRIQSTPDCHEDFLTSAFITSGSDPFAMAVAGQVPPVLLGLTLTGNQNACSACVEFWVVKLARTGPP